ncbi:MAG TPA: hypothetical protein VF611_11860, partial [Pyrinomonadaceae bacterium]
VSAWERHFATFRTWEACKRRLVYRENWVEWDELQKAKQSEAFRFLESELRRAALTVPEPGGLPAPPGGGRPPARPGVSLLQQREPAVVGLLNPAREGLGLSGTPERHARPTWLAPSQNAGASDLPMWLRAAVRMGARFVRVAAAGVPPAVTTFEPKCGPPDASACCTACGKAHAPLVDEYYFWIEDARHYEEKRQVAEWGATDDDPQTDWHRPGKLPGLLHWNSQPMVHLRWCRVHNGEFRQPRQSYEGVRITPGATPQLVFLGRGGDSLHFEVTGGETPAGYPSSPQPGFRYDLAADEAVVLPQVVSAPAPSPVGGLASYPFFAWYEPGAPLSPLSPFSPAAAVAGHLRAHCRFESALKWYESLYNPLLSDNTWVICPAKVPDGATPHGAPPHPHPSEHHAPAECCCAGDPVSDAEVKDRAVLMHYLDTLLQWGDALMRKNRPEAFRQARLIFETAAKILGAAPVSVPSKDEGREPRTVAEFKPDCAPVNPRLMCLYAGVDDRLGLIHQCLNAARLKDGRANLDMPYFGGGEVRDCWKITNDACADEGDWCLPQSPYRFTALIQKAQEVAGDVRALGGALLAAYEKGDAEYLSAVRTMHERQLLNLALEIRQNQCLEAEWEAQALRKTKELAITQRIYNADLIANGLKNGESQYVFLTNLSQGFRLNANIAEIAAGVMGIIPDIYAGVPVSQTHMPVGLKLAEATLLTVGRIMNALAEHASTNANLELTRAGWERREDEWRERVKELDIEIARGERQILAAERRLANARRELNNLRRQMENAAEVQDFLRDKFTSHDLYLWMQQETAAVYYQMYEMALAYARKAQRALNFEQGYTARQFIPEEVWDNLREGLLSGERLQLSLRLMEKSYFDGNGREYELTKHFSLRTHFPVAFLQLRTNGYCEVELPEWMFDLDYPGHYMRRIRDVKLTIPCVAGPYTGVHCRLTLLSSKTRVDPRLADPPRACCREEGRENGYRATPDDPRVVSTYAAAEAIATSGGQNDSGMFELNFRDERYLPFEFAGAVSRWRIELRPENNQFDMETLSDVVMHLDLTAREGGEGLRRAANDCAQQNLPGAGVRFFDVRREFPEAWHLFADVSPDRAARRELGIQLGRNMFPYLPSNKRISVRRLEILFATPGADPSAHHVVEFLAGWRAGRLPAEDCDTDVLSVACVASAEWPGLFHGVLDVDLESLGASGQQDLGVFRFPRDVGEVKDAYLFCGYTTL